MMLSRKEKAVLQQAFEPPKAKKKRAFLRTLPGKEVGVGDLILSQAPYIRKWVWLVSAVVFAAAVFVSKYMDAELVWILSSLMPFVALSVLAEVAKSSAYGMTELEMTSRFSMRTMLFARMSLIGIAQFLVLTLAVLFLYVTDMQETTGNGGVMLVQGGVYLLVPYLLTTVLGLMAVRRLHGRESIYVCGSISVFVGVLNAVGKYLVPVVFAEQNVGWWVLAAVLLMASLVKEYRKTMNQMEELVWN